jgi:two-component system chemotaxis sensor kinase CheA
MTEELELFAEDTEEQLQFMENALLDATETGVDDEKIGAIFRAMHTIKGTAGMFGFDDVVSFTHVAENLLDEVRQGNVELTPPMLSLMLKSKDHVDSLAQLSINEEDITEEITETGEELLTQLRAMMPGATPAAPVEDKVTESASGAPAFEVFDAPAVAETSSAGFEVFDMPAPEASPSASAGFEVFDMPAPSPEVEGDAIWHLSLRLGEDFFTTGMSMLSIFNFFKESGEVLMNVPVVSKIPHLNALNPQKAYIGYEILYQTSSSKEDIEVIFEFVEDDIDLMVFQQSDTQALSKLIEKRKSENLQALLVESGLYEEDSFATIKQEPIMTESKAAPKVETKEPVKAVAPTPSPKKETQAKEKKEPAKKASKSSSLRVDSNKIDVLINQMSEMVIANARILEISENSENMELEESANLMNELLEQVRDGIMDIRMMQVGDSFMKFRRIVNDTAKKIGKDIDFVISGGDTELDKTVIEKISDPLVHMLRNSVDHGVETPEQREAAGKSGKGRIDLRAYPDAGTIVIEIEDNGNGINKEKVLEKAIASGIVSASDNLSDKEIYDLIFAAGLSTADKVSDISGRGVGMDVVKRNIEDLRGTLDVDSVSGKGSKITIRLPLTLAIIDGFLVQVGDTKYVIPLDMIQECIELDDEARESMKGNQFINLRGEILPLLNVHEYFNEKVYDEGRENVLVVKYTDKVVGLKVDELYGEHQTVIKPLGETFQQVPGVSGGSILGSGEVSLIVDVPSLIDYKLKQTKGA